MRHTEVEFKYRVSELKLSDFTKAAQALNPTSYVEASGSDYYFTDSKGVDFVRYRAGDRQEFTTKKKTEAGNNYVRDEFNLLIGKGQTLDRISSFLNSVGYPRLNFSIFKTCFIYYYEKFDLVYYVVYDVDMREMDRFLEIEMLEDYPWKSEAEARTHLAMVESWLAPLGAVPANRESKSLFERYRKD